MEYLVTGLPYAQWIHELGSKNHEIARAGESWVPSMSSAK